MSTIQCQNLTPEQQVLILSWVASTIPTRTWTDVVWNGSVFCAVASASAVAATSPDGITWTERVLPSSATWGLITWNGSVFVTVATSSNKAATSPDGITWTARTLPASRNWSALASNSSYIFLLARSYNYLTRSADGGATWTATSNLGASNWWSDVCANGTTVIVTTTTAGQNTKISYNNGDTWSDVTTNAMDYPVSLYSSSNVGEAYHAVVRYYTSGNYYYNTVYFNGSTFVKGKSLGTGVYRMCATGTEAYTYYNTTLYKTTDNGTTWSTAITIPQLLNDNYGSIMVGKGATLISLPSSTTQGNYVISTDSGATWQYRSAGYSYPTTNYLMSTVGYVDGKWVAHSYSQNNGITETVTSPDGTTWTASGKAPLIINALPIVKANGKRFALSTSGGTYGAVSSDEGATWGAVTYPSGSFINSVCSLNEKVFIANSSSLNCYSTQDGATWTTLPYSGTESWVYAPNKVIPLSEGASTSYAVIANKYFNTTTDGVTTATALYGAAFSGNTHIGAGSGVIRAVGVLNTTNLYYSKDSGITWAVTTAPFTFSNNGTYAYIEIYQDKIIVGNYDNTTVRTFDTTALTWSSVVLKIPGNIFNADFTAFASNEAGMTVGVGGNGSGVVGYSTNNGLTWTSAYMPENATITFVSYSNGAFYAFSSTKTYSSADGITWVDKWSHPMGTVYAVFWDTVKFNVLGSVGMHQSTNLHTSSTPTWNYTGATGWAITKKGTTLVVARNGSTIHYTTEVPLTTSYGFWTARTLATSVSTPRLVANADIFCLIQEANTTVYYTSTDGITWTQRALPITANWRGLAWNGSVFITFAWGSTSAYTSPDGITWTLRTLPESLTPTRVIWDGVNFIINNQISGNFVYTSPDGITWTKRATATLQALSPVSFQTPSTSTKGITAIGTNLFAFHTHVTYKLYNSTDGGLTWVKVLEIASGLVNATTAVVWNGTSYCFVATVVAGGYKSYLSADGITWDGGTTISHASLTAGGYTSFAAVTGYFVMLTNNATKDLLISTDGITWSVSAATYASSRYTVIPSYAQNTATQATLVGFGSTLFMSAGGGVVVSTDLGVTWTYKPSYYTAAMTRFVKLLVEGSNLVGYTDRSKFVSTDNGVTWGTAIPLCAGISISDIAIGGSIIASVYSTSQTNFWWSSDNGVTWASKTLPYSPRMIVYVDGKFFVSDYNSSSFIYSSTDCVTWTTTSIPVAMSARTIVSDGTRLIAYDEIGNTITSIDNGASWQAFTAPITVSVTKVFEKIVETSEGFVLYGSFSEGTNTCHCLTSVDGLTWQDTPKSGLGSVSGNLVTGSKNSSEMFLVPSNSNTVYRRASFADTTWTPVVGSYTITPYASLTTATKTFVFVSSSSTCYELSASGIVARTLPATKTVTSSSGLVNTPTKAGFSVSGSTGKPATLTTSTDGVVWSNNDMLAPVTWNLFNSVSYSGSDYLFTVNDNNSNLVVGTSPDGLAVTTKFVGTTANSNVTTIYAQTAAIKAGNFVSLLSSTTDKSVYSFDSLATFSVANLPSTSYRSLAYDPTSRKLVAVGTNGVAVSVLPPE